MIDLLCVIKESVFVIQKLRSVKFKVRTCTNESVFVLIGSYQVHGKLRMKKIYTINVILEIYSSFQFYSRGCSYENQQKIY